MFWSIAKQNIISLVTLVALALLATALFVSEASAQANLQINYQGKLTDNLGSTVTDGVYNIAFNLYTAPTGGTPIWTSTTTATTTNGLFSYMLGSSSTLNGVDFDQTL